MDGLGRSKAFVQAVLNDGFVRVMTRGAEGASVSGALARALLQHFEEKLEKHSGDMLLKTAVGDVLNLARSVLVMLAEEDATITTGILEDTLGRNCKQTMETIRNLVAQNPFWRDGQRKALQRAVAEKQYRPDINEVSTRFLEGQVDIAEAPKLSKKLVLWKEGLPAGVFASALMQTYCPRVVGHEPQSARVSLALCGGSLDLTEAGCLRIGVRSISCN